MKIIVTSDVHIEFDRRGILLIMADAIADEAPDVFVIAGDLAHSPAGFRRVLDLFSCVPGIKAVIAGNHDLWRGALGERPRPTSQRIFDTILPALAREQGWLWLEQDDVRIGQVMICGTIGWYDYGVALLNHPEWSPAEIRGKKHAFNNDGSFMDLDWDDLAFAADCRNRLAQRLDRLQQDPSLEKGIVVTHVPVFMGQRVHQYGDHPMADGYFSNLSLGKAVASYGKITHVISGHTHRHAKALIPRDGLKPIDAKVVGSDYGAPRYEVVMVD